MSRTERGISGDRYSRNYRTRPITIKLKENDNDYDKGSMIGATECQSQDFYLSTLEWYSKKNDI
ncbi:hypothetical protein WCU81_11575 [Pectobacterium atrosepticum]|uniref:hypothetical protein n=1 Tax=Pectobacterium atrosepticum TaxID=29471 RepID=UPI00030F8EE0|nr:hypothetical protein [Pectobacterium atrosepticum]MBL0896117.1 hypothetical protein [Pectobacterium atrosepticum]MCA6980742.1 hypothetical protein [Pectobacterium atrosepticum]MCL6319010.1 hypothetical protein [Pectobacterium atrosepticum]MDK9441048.1 hypothetical protein [Pectobacterium atrosepticum]